MRKTIRKKVLLWRQRGWVWRKGLLIITMQAQKALGDGSNAAASREKETFGKCQRADTTLYSEGATSVPSQNGPWWSWTDNTCSRFIKHSWLRKAQTWNDLIFLQLLSQSLYAKSPFSLERSLHSSGSNSIISQILSVIERWSILKLWYLIQSFPCSYYMSGLGLWGKEVGRQAIPIQHQAGCFRMVQDVIQPVNPMVPDTP